VNIDASNRNLQYSVALGLMMIFDHKIYTNIAFLVSCLQGWLHAVKQFYIRI